MSERSHVTAIVESIIGRQLICWSAYQPSVDALPARALDPAASQVRSRHAGSANDCGRPRVHCFVGTVPGRRCRRKQIACHGRRTALQKTPDAISIPMIPAAMTQLEQESSIEFAAASVLDRVALAAFVRRHRPLPLSRLDVSGHHGGHDGGQCPVGCRALHTRSSTFTERRGHCSPRLSEPDVRLSSKSAGVGRMSDACWRRTRADAASSSCSATPRRWISDRSTTALVCSSMRSADHLADVTLLARLEECTRPRLESQSRDVDDQSRY